ncbi:MAG: 2Fe-2S iron-sulfur cluster binding domain-containing protein [Acidobacteria bacterium]|nr:2Fe-2S iron-sulfur cluster binding domain-containing protein [Acidobacteriota bacterium]
MRRLRYHLRVETVTLTIDGRQVSVPKGTTVLQAAIQAGIQVPYYCYHPGLGVDASCRVCLVKIEKFPKLQTSCSTPVAEGMVVHTNDREAVEGRAGVFEFLLINHPLDCPVCDKGGECPLQDFSYTFGNTDSRMDFPRRTFDGEGVKADVDFGPTLMLNRNRCIMCTRCERFMREVDGDAQIGVINRGNGSEIATFNDEGIHSLLSGNLMDVCPVGAITTKQYRFRSRPWDNPHAVDTICTGCSKGCSTTGWLKAKPEWAKGGRLIRMTPRYNPQVNDYWMCDIGRFNFGWVESDTRLRRPEVRTRDGALQHVTWKDALSRVRDVMATAARNGQGAVQFLASAHASVEELFLLKRLAAEAPGAGASALHITYTRREKVQPATTHFHIPATDAPNLTGAADLGLRIGAGLSGDADLSALKTAVAAGSVSLVYVVDLGADGSMGDMQWLIDARMAGHVSTLVYEGVVTSALAGVADIVLPGSAWVEKDAVYTNDQGHVQASSKAITPPGEAVDDWQILTSVGAALGLEFTYTSSHEVRAAVAAALASQPAYASLADTTFNRPVTAEHWLQSSNPMERMKWQDLFQDLPPVKGHNVQMENQPPATVIPLRLVTEEVARASE